MARLQLYRENDQIVTLPSVLDEITKAPIVGATVNMTLYDTKGNIVEPINGVLMSDVTGQPGFYEAQVTEQFVAPAGSYMMVYKGNKDGIDFTRKQDVTVSDWKFKN